MKRDRAQWRTVILLLALLFGVRYTLYAEVTDLVRHYHDEVTRLDGGPTTISCDSTAATVAIEIRVAPTGRERPSEWGAGWITDDGGRWDLDIVPGTEWTNEEVPKVIITLRHNHRKVASQTLSKGVAFDNGANTLILEWGRLEQGISEGYSGSLTVYYGSDYPEEVFNAECGKPNGEVLFTSSRQLSVLDLVVEEGVPASRKAVTDWTPESIAVRLRTAIRPEGMYEYLDRENDPKYVRLGGRYSLALVRDTSGGFLMLYTAGAETNSSQWKPGMIKGRLTPTRFQGQYNLLWYDAVFTDRGDEGYATIDPDTGLLTLYFPILKATLRFVRSAQR